MDWQPPAPAQLVELVETLEQATQFAKSLPSATDPSHRDLVFSALNAAQISLTSFLGEHNSKDPSIGGVEELMRDLSIQNKRPRRSISPSRIGDTEIQSSLDFDPHVAVLRSLELVYKFRW